MPFGSTPYGSSPFGASEAVSVTAATAERILFLSPRSIDQAVLAASSEKGTLVVTNLQDRQPQKKWRSLTAVDQYVTVALARPVAFNALAIVGHGFTSAGVLRVRGAATAAAVTAAPVIDTGWQSVWAAGAMPDVEGWAVWTSLLRWANDAALGFARIDVADTGADYIEIGRLALARAFQPGVNVDLNLGKAFEPPDIQTRTAFGFTYSDDRGNKPRRFVLPFSGASEADLTAFGDLQRLAGLAGDIFVAIDPAKTSDFHRYALHGLFAAGGAYEALPLWDDTGNIWALSLTINELL